MAAVALPAVLWAEQRPNIIYIMTDQQTASAMSCAGNSDVHTPNMDLLASRGVRFVNAYCAFPLSGPTRSSMFTGYMPSQIGTIENNLPIPDSVASRTLGRFFQNPVIIVLTPGSGMHIRFPYRQKRHSVFTISVRMAISDWQRHV